MRLKVVASSELERRAKILGSGLEFLGTMDGDNWTRRRNLSELAIHVAGEIPT